MDKRLIQSAKQLNKKRKLRRIRNRVMMALSCAVILSTVYILSQPAITQEQDTFCGMEAHTHDLDCYTRNRQLICTLSEGEVHAHSDACYQSETVHIHEDACYEISDGHVHSEICYEILPGHTHEEGCYEIQTGHTHSEACYEVTAGHGHTESCYTLVPGHSHSEQCYDEDQANLLCGQTETEDRTELSCTEPESDEKQELICTVDESDDQQVLICDLEEQEENSVLICTEPEAEENVTLICDQATEETILVCEIDDEKEHEHKRKCYADEEDEPLTCNLAESETHEHTQLCYGDWELTCSKETHSHILQCYSDPDADVEKPSQWEKTFRDVTITGLHRDDLLAIARTQLGYRESTRNYIVEDDGETISGYTRYGDWYGAPYAEWCAMFVSFCIEYAQIPDVPQHASCPVWIGLLEEQELYISAEDHVPLPGEIIFFDGNGNGYSDHVGIVEEVTEDGTIKTIEGNSGKAVVRDSYELDDPKLLGYGLIPEGKLISGDAEPEETAAPEDTTEPEETTEPEAPPAVVEQTIRAEIYTDETLRHRSEDKTVILISGMMPEGSTARAYPVTLDADLIEGQTVLLAYDITIVDRDGNPLEQGSNGNPFVVSIQPPDWTPSDDENYNVYYVPEDGDPEMMDSESHDDAVSFTTDHFSTYALTATGSNNTIYLNGASGDDSKAGTSTSTAVKTLEKALTLVKEGGTIYITGTVTVSGTQEWDLDNSVTIKRNSSFTGPLVTVANGATLTLKNITIHGNSSNPSSSNIATNSTYAGSSKAPLIVVSDSGNLVINAGTVLTNNSNKPDMSNNKFVENSYVGQGGAIYCTGTLTMNGGTIQYCEAQSGGGIYIENGTFNLKGGLIDSNYARDIVPSSYRKNAYHKNAGGGVYVGDNSTMNMSGGTISNNQSSREGGGVSLGWLNHTKGAAINEFITTFNMTGGTFTGNTATSTGGGLNVTAGRQGFISAGTFTNNRANGKEYQPSNSSSRAPVDVYSGGAIYIDAQQKNGSGSYAGKPGYVVVNRVLITNNQAQYWGGGIACCSTSEAYVNASIELNNGTAIYGNTAGQAGNELHLDGDIQVVGNKVLGGGDYNWTKNGNGYDNSLTDSSAAIVAAKKLATVIITGNYGLDGGGIGCNGVIEVGGTTSTESISITKVWNDDGTVPHPDFITVQIYQDGKAYGDPVTMYPTVDANGKETWPTLYVDSLPADHTYTVKEIDVPGFDSEVSVNGSNITITNTPAGFKVVKKWEGDTESDRPASIRVQLFRNGAAYGDVVTLTAANNWKYIWQNLPEGDTYTAKEVDVPDGYYILSDGELLNESTWQITNIKNPTTSVSVEKRWEGGEPLDSVTVYLLSNGVKVKEATLNAANGWFYKWDNLPVYGKLGDTIAYTVQEAPVRGFASTVTVGTSPTQTTSVWKSASSLESGKSYLLVSSNGALATNTRNGLTWSSVSDILESGVDAESRELWTWSDSRLKNGGGRFLALSNGSFTTNSSGTSITWSSGKISASSSGTNYYLTKNNNGSVGTGTNSNNALVFTAYERITRTVAGSDQHFVVTNTKLPDSITFRFAKYAVGSKKSTLLAGAQLSLYKVSDDGNVTIPGTNVTGTLVRSWTSENGASASDGFHIEDLFSGTYYLIETFTPTGHVGLSGPVIFEVNAEYGQVQVIQSPYELTLTTGSEIDFPVYNNVAYELPETGGPGHFLYTMGGMLLTAAAGLTLLYNQTKRRKEEHASS